MVYHGERITDEERILPHMWSDDFDHVESVVVEEEVDIERGDEADSIAWDARITHYSIDEIRGDVDTERDGLLVLSETYDPFWKASVDGAPAALHRADYALRA